MKNEGLVAFLYILMRDLPTGELAKIINEHVYIDTTRYDFTNKHLEAAARELATRIEISPKQSNEW